MLEAAPTSLNWGRMGSAPLISEMTHIYGFEKLPPTLHHQKKSPQISEGGC